MQTLRSLNDTPLEGVERAVADIVAHIDSTGICVVTGAQPGAEQTALMCAARLGLETLAILPSDMRSKGGLLTASDLARLGVRSTRVIPDRRYQVRLWITVAVGDATIVVGALELPSVQEAIRACARLGQPCWHATDLENSDAVTRWLHRQDGVRVLNIIGCHPLPLEMAEEQQIDKFLTNVLRSFRRSAPPAG